MNKNKYWKHFKTIVKHKWEVCKLCFNIGLYWQGITHDLSKFSPVEFFSSAKYFQGGSSPINAEKREKGYSLAWQHHKGHNPHHWEYWIDNLSTYDNTPLRIPHKYILEMICDWVAAGKVYGDGKWNKEEPWDYYQKHKDDYILHNDVRDLIEFYLIVIKEDDLKGFIKMAKNTKKGKEKDCRDED